MCIYVISYTVQLFLTLLEFIKRNSPNANRFFLIVFMLFFSGLAGIRYGLGEDYYTYLFIFDYIDSFANLAYLEPGFRAIITIIKMLGLPGISLFFIFSFISLFFLIKGVLKSSTRPMMSIFIYMCVFYLGYVFNGLRQGIAMSIFIYLLHDIENRKFKKVLFYSLLATSVHYSGIFILISYFAYNAKVTPRKYAVLAVIALVLILFNSAFVDIVIKVMPSFVSDKILSYMRRSKDSIDLVGILQRILIMLPFFMYYYKLSRTHRNFRGLFNIYFLGFILYSLFSFQGLFATRINMFFRILEVILIPQLFDIPTHKMEKLLVLVLIVIWASMLFYSVALGPAYSPFRTIPSIVLQ